MRGLLLGAFVAVAILSGCGVHAVENAPSLDQIAAVTRSDSYRFQISMETEGINDALTVTATGSADPAERLSVIRYRLDGPDEEDVEVEVRRIGDETYTRYPATGSVFDGWSKESTTETDELMGPFGAFSEPHRAADALAQHGRDVRTEPGERIGGVTTTLYHATVPTIELLGGGASKAQRDELEEEIRGTDSELAEVEAWAGADGLVRKLEFEIQISEKGETGHFRVSMRFSDFGEPLDVQAPPASEMHVYPDPDVEVSSGPCRGEVAPHSPKKVAAALRDAGFEVTVRCQAGDTRIAAEPAGDGEAIFCGISAEVTRPPNVPPHSLVAGNVACWGPESAEQQAALRNLLDGL